jgi:hypothetical protein
MLDILTVMDIILTGLITFDPILLDYILILLETSFVRELLSHVCRCPVELRLEGNILLYNGVLSFRLTEYLGLEGCANTTNGRS